MVLVLTISYRQGRFPVLKHVQANPESNGAFSHDSKTLGGGEGGGPKHWTVAWPATTCCTLVDLPPERGSLWAGPYRAAARGRRLRLTVWAAAGSSNQIVVLM